jgi:hypothetical protein
VKLLAGLSRSLTLRRWRSEKERRRRGRRGRLQSAKQSTNARQKESARSKLATLKKLYKRLQKASARLQQLQNQLQSVLVVLEVLGVALLFMSRPRHLQQQSTAAAAKFVNHASFGSKFRRIGL